MSHTTKEEEILKQYGCKDFRNFGKKEIMQLVSQLPNMDKELAIAVISNVPDFINLALEGFKDMYKISDKILSDSTNEYTILFEQYKTTLEILHSRAQNPDITHEEFMDYMDQIDAVSEKFMEMKRQSDETKLEVLKTVGKTIITTIGIIAVAAFGVNMNRDNDKINEN